ncbi:MAG: 50S ribosomal protein L35 [Chloroherpetonaceae bacterium]|nr:50S ribosomal protein L35 [Chloroherpetonaceae bacterium]MDW8438700.1 50S ribosomal protein L35 [Chloroherpetonaceae bacterium]
MPKMKRMSSAKKRFKATATGKIKRKRSGMRHNLGKKSARRKRALQRDALVAPTHKPTVKEMLLI